MFVKISFICGKQKRVLLAVKKKTKKKRQTTCNANKKKIRVYNILFLSLEPTWSGLNIHRNTKTCVCKLKLNIS